MIFNRSIASAITGVILVVCLVTAMLVGTTAAPALEQEDVEPPTIGRHDTVKQQLTLVKLSSDQLDAADSSSSEKKDEDIMKDFVYSEEIPLSKDLQKFIYKQCKEQKLEYHVVLALIRRESNFNASAIGYNSNGTRDNGLMQINDCNKTWLYNKLGIDNLLDPQQNVIAGTTMLGEYAAKYGMYNALVAYQFGEQGMLNRVNAGITTHNGVDKLFAKGEEYKELIEATPVPL